MTAGFKFSVAYVQGTIYIEDQSTDLTRTSNVLIENNYFFGNEVTPILSLEAQPNK